MARPKKLIAPPPETHERAWHEGTVKEVRPGVWRAWRERVHRADGTTARPSKTFKGLTAETDAASWAKGEPTPDVMYLGQWLERWYALRKPTLADSTRINYLAAIDACGDLLRRPIAELTEEDWQAQTNRVLERWSRYNVQVWRTIIGMALRAAIPRYLDGNPLARVKLPKPDEKPTRAWRQDEVDRLLGECVGTPHEAWVLFCLGTGVRLGESRALLWEDVDLRSRTATIRASLDSRTNKRGPTKTRRVRVVEIPDDVVPALVALRARQPSNQTLVFGHGDNAYVYSTLRNWLMTRCRHAGIRELSPHSLRHTCASLAFEDRVPVQDVARQLGHSVKTCQTTYAHFIGDDMRRVARSLGKALRHRFSGPKRRNGTQNGTRTGA